MTMIITEGCFKDNSFHVSETDGPFVCREKGGEPRAMGVILYLPFSAHSLANVVTSLN